MLSQRCLMAIFRKHAKMYLVMVPFWTPIKRLLQCRPHSHFCLSCTEKHIITHACVKQQFECSFVYIYAANVVVTQLDLCGCFNIDLHAIIVGLDRIFFVYSKWIFLISGLSQNTFKNISPKSSQTILGNIDTRNKLHL